MGRVQVRGSEKAAAVGGRDLGAPADDAAVEVMLRLRRRVSGAAARLDERGRDEVSGRHLSRDEFAAELGASEADVARVEAFAAEHGMGVVETHPGARTVTLSGAARDVCAAFGVALRLRQVGGRVDRVREGAVQIPEALADVVVGVFGLDNRPAARPLLRRRATPHAAAPHAGYFPEELAAPYGFPEGLTGKGETVAVIELGGGYHLAEMRAYFRSRGLPVPSITAVSVRGGRNRPSGDLGGDDGEVVLDVQVLGALAPGAAIVVYFCPNTDDGFLSAVLAAIHDRRRRPSVVSISWGAEEAAWTAQSLRAFDEAFAEAALLGVTVCAAAGDDGSSDGDRDRKTHVDFPASSPHVLACGGTRLEGGAETVWNNGRGRGATGGGVSRVFPRPAWQDSASVPMALDPPGFAGRALPDVAANADPDTGYRVAGDGAESVIGGTSAVAPLMAALVARFNEHLGRARPAGHGAVGLPHPALYRQPVGSFRDITKGDNGAFSARPGWDACSGLGAPVGARILESLDVAAPAAAAPVTDRR